MEEIPSFLVDNNMDKTNIFFEGLTQYECDLIALALDTYLMNFNVNPNDEDTLEDLFFRFDHIADPNPDQDDSTFVISDKAIPVRAVEDAEGIITILPCNSREKIINNDSELEVLQIDFQKKCLTSR